MFSFLNRGIVLVEFLSLLAVQWAHAAASIPNLSNPNLSKVSERAYALVGDMDIPNQHNDGFICNSVFVITDIGVVVVDPGGSVQVGRMIINEIRKVTDKPITHVFNTHHHADHWMGNHAFAELSPPPLILAHPVMRDTAEQIGEQWLEIISNLTKGKNQGTKVVLPDHLVNGGETLRIGGINFLLYHPEHAHTKGDIVIYLPEEKILLPGDVLFYLRTPGFQDASPLGNAKALEYLSGLDFTHVVPGHGPVTDKSGVTYMLDYIHLLHKEVKKYFDQGMQDFEIKDKIDVGRFRNMSGFKERFGINVNRMYLEIEQSDF